MNQAHGYVLILDPNERSHPDGSGVYAQLNRPVYVAVSLDQAVAQAETNPPCLVILMGSDDHPHWTQPLVRRLRQVNRTLHTTIVALTDSGSPHWDHQEDSPGVDGFLVRPLSDDVLRTLVESAFVKHQYQHPPAI